MLQNTCLGGIKKEERVCLEKHDNVQKCTAISSDLTIDLVCFKVLDSIFEVVS